MPALLGVAAQPVVCAVFPRALLPLGQDEVAGLLGVRLRGAQGTGALLSTLTRQLPRHLHEYGAAAGARLGVTLLDLMSVALADRLDRGKAIPPDSRRRALLTRIYAFIEARLPEPDLSPDAIAAAHHISTRYLHKLFKAEGATVVGWIRRRRRERCRRDLPDPTLRARSVAAIATRWGFSSPAHFNRLFRETYGFPPGEFRDLWGVPGAAE